MEKLTEVNYKKDFCEKYFDKNSWDLDVLKQVDVLLKDKKENPLLYIESKFRISSTNETLRRQALAQLILTNKKQSQILARVALIYQNENSDDILELVDCSDDSVMFNNDINWSAEKPSLPSKDAVDRINDRIKGKITRYENDEILEFYRNLKSGDETQIKITGKNFNVVYNQWKNEISFTRQIPDEQELINLFLVDILNGTKYESQVSIEIAGKTQKTFQPLVREGTSLSKYEIFKTGDKVRIIYDEKEVFTVADFEAYEFFWKKYKRPPEYGEFLEILERSATLYSEKYRRDTGGEYTPTCFVEKQNEILREHYNLDDFIVFDPCAGVGNLENQFGKDFKQFCYLSTLEPMDVDICKIKGFENTVQFDYLKDGENPKFKYKGEILGIDEICRRENRRLMIVMNPPYQRKREFKNNLAIEFFNKAVRLKPDVIVFYYETKSFLNSEAENYISAGYKIVSHIFSNAATTFLLSEWSISQVIFEKAISDENDSEKAKNPQPAFTGDTIIADRYELEKGEFVVKKTYAYSNSSPNLFKELKSAIKENQNGMVLGNYSYLNDVIKIGNGGSDRGNNVTTENLKLCLLSKGLIFNTHHKYFELNSVVYRGKISQIPEELFNDAVMFSLFYKGILFSNKSGHKNYIMPFSSAELGCAKNDLNVLFPHKAELELSFDGNDDDGAGKEKPFDFREFMKEFEFSSEAKELYRAALEVFLYYHKNDEYKDKNYNDSFYDITNAIMGKDISTFRSLEKNGDTRISKTKTTKGTRGFGRNTIKTAVASEYLPVFEKFFDVRDTLARKINRELLSFGLLLWERENIY